MTLSDENDENKEVSDAQLMADISNTQAEKDAYLQLAEGFGTLSRLPENIESGEAKMHHFQDAKYTGLAVRCDEFLKQLLAIKAERGIK